MNKKLLTVAIGAALAAAPMLAAQADVKVYGRLQAEVANVDVGGSDLASSSNVASHVGVSRNVDSVILNDTGLGRLGVAADEDLGGGLKAVGLIEFGVDTADGAANASSPISQREIYVGLDHKAAGSLQFGRFNSPYLNTGVALDPFVTTLLEARGNLGMTGNADGFGVLNGHQGFLSDGMRYQSPILAGFQAVVYLGLDGTGTAATCGIANGVAAGGAAGNACVQGAQTNGDLSASIGWKSSAVNVFLAYNKMANVTPTSTTHEPEPTAMKIGAQFKFGGSIKNTISVQHELINRDSGAASTSAGDEAVMSFLGYQLGIGNTTIAAQLGLAANDQTNAADTAQKVGTYYAVGVIQNLSKTARVFGGFRKTELEDDNTANAGGVVYRDETVVSLGVRKDF